MDARRVERGAEALHEMAHDLERAAEHRGLRLEAELTLLLMMRARA
jgi:hypothetical protein